jgi:hypothetical protein
VEQFLARLYLPRDRTLDYLNLLPLGTRGLAQKKCDIDVKQEEGTLVYTQGEKRKKASHTVFLNFSVLHYLSDFM